MKEIGKVAIELKKGKNGKIKNKDPGFDQFTAAMVASDAQGIKDKVAEIIMCSERTKQEKNDNLDIKSLKAQLKVASIDYDEVLGDCSKKMKFLHKLMRERGIGL
jgi:hypothetical protein